MAKVSESMETSRNPKKIAKAKEIGKMLFNKLGKFQATKINKWESFKLKASNSGMRPKIKRKNSSKQSRPATNKNKPKTREKTYLEMMGNKKIVARVNF